MWGHSISVSSFFKKPGKPQKLAKNALQLEMGSQIFILSQRTNKTFHTGVAGKKVGPVTEQQK